MEFDAFTNNIEPGGLRNSTEVKILMCYLLTSVSQPLSRNQINEIATEKGLANYFEVNTALDALLKAGVIVQNEPDVFSSTEKSKTISEALEVSLPFTVRQQAVDSALKLLASIKRESENTVEITRDESGYFVNCNVSDNEICLMNLRVYVADILQAEKTRKNFLENATEVYKRVLSAVTGTEKF